MRLIAIVLLASILAGCTFDEINEAFHDPAWECLGQLNCTPAPITPTASVPDENEAPAGGGVVYEPNDEGL